VSARGCGAPGEGSQALVLSQAVMLAMVQDVTKGVRPLGAFFFSRSIPRYTSMHFTLYNYTTFLLMRESIHHVIFFSPLFFSNTAQILHLLYYFI
jgi:hypothetical protein